ncbi:DUF3105 domain-containing protein [Luteipulveratus mongoliensis]|uniref:DUF3105 domain-containing protein n=1 Tax=Luteipulveratus mongoliensis TaxID=571913 RepID=A0A0K1JNE4_9MICO|nr:DUF3105 domain-containing protein [Luteipulveratus mongoliensis]AKU18115.1 hypothetical protein VV02_23375 [Luteipulveratus mongoliensis]
MMYVVRARRATAVSAAVAGVLALSACQQEAPSATLPPRAASVVKTYPVPSRNHTSGTVHYPQSPPVGGNHNPLWINCGIYDKPIPNENAVHSLEHGVVWITYKPNVLSQADLGVLRTLARQPYMLMSPYADQETPVVLTAWGKQLEVQDVRDPHVAAFVKDFLQGPQTPERGAPCSGGYDPEGGSAVV